MGLSVSGEQGKVELFSGADPAASGIGRLWASGGGEMLTNDEFGVRDFIPPRKIFVFFRESCCPTGHLIPRPK